MYILPVSMFVSVIKGEGVIKVNRAGEAGRDRKEAIFS
jgi:hypothetical protein